MYFCIGMIKVMKLDEQTKGLGNKWMETFITEAAIPINKKRIIKGDSDEAD